MTTARGESRAHAFRSATGVTETPAMFLALFQKTASCCSGATSTVDSPSPSAASIPATAAVLGPAADASIGRAATSFTSSSASRDASAMRVAAWRAFRGIRQPKSRGCFAKMWPPPRRVPLRRPPARALPVPFCRYSFLVEPATSPRVFVLCVPWR